jgi:hypothetical protein
VRRFWSFNLLQLLGHADLIVLHECCGLLVRLRTERAHIWPVLHVTYDIVLLSKPDRVAQRTTFTLNVYSAFISVELPAITVLPSTWNGGRSLRFDVSTGEVVVELLMGLAGPIGKQCWKGDLCNNRRMTYRL